ncbi:helix-turn-helix transcriptional regulator [Antribacter gilvus]|uniref:helix-turn-helix transcriptional regulator n=1 Tax=Antribacter gilvus TaxID=2304675 RepID=UPI000F7B5618|nr:LuxR C-terminal-related transcriptional regulator [Antribacter gilvus]
MVGQAPRRHGRSEELRSAAAALDLLGEGSVALLLVGEPGSGRTTFLDDVARGFAAGRALRVGAPPAGAAYGGVQALHRAVRPTAPPAAPSTEGLLRLLRDAADDGPLLLCVDDVQRWDPPSRGILGATARRIGEAPGVGLLVSVTGVGAAATAFAGRPLLRLAPLSRAAAEALLDDLAPGVDAAVREELLREADGNPALLRALVHRLSPGERSGTVPLPHPVADPRLLAGVAGDDLAGLPQEAQDVLLVAAAAHVGGLPGGTAWPDVDLVLRAADRMPPGAFPGAFLLEGDRLAGGSLVRRALLAGAPADRRRAAHHALADVLESDGHRLPALLHRALAVTGQDAGLAATLADAAADPAAVATFAGRSAALARAAELTPDASERAARWTGAAEQALLAGRPGEARRLLGEADGGAGSVTVRGRAELLRGTLALGDGPMADAYASLVLARSLLADDEPLLALTATFGATDAAWNAGDLAACLAALDPLDVLAAPGPDTSVHDYLVGFRALLERRLDDALPPLHRVLDAGRAQDEPEPLLRAAAAALLLGDIEVACHAGARALAAARARGRDGNVPQALEYLAYAELRAGRHARARAHAEEGLRVALRSGRRNTAAHHRAVLALAASIEGDADEVTAQVTEALATARSHGLAQTVALAEWAAGRADLGRGRPSEAAARLGAVVRPGRSTGHFAVRPLAMPCFVEAAVSAGLAEEARPIADEFAIWAAFGADPQAPAQLARCRALLAPPDDADALFQHALLLHEQAGGDFERARTQLLYGKWLRRRRRPREARDRLRDALHAFERCGARVWADQARTELRANGEALAGPRDGALALLTPHQLRIARQVADGATNREVAQSLSVSIRTVDHHLRNIFAVLGVRSRVDLARLVGREPA